MSVQKVSKTYLQSQVFKVPRRQCWCLGSSLALVCCCPTGLCKSSFGRLEVTFLPHFVWGHTPHLSTIDESPASWDRKKVPSKLATIASNWVVGSPTHLKIYAQVTLDHIPTICGVKIPKNLWNHRTESCLVMLWWFSICLKNAQIPVPFPLKSSSSNVPLPLADSTSSRGLSGWMIATAAVMIPSIVFTQDGLYCSSNPDEGFLRCRTFSNLQTFKPVKGKIFCVNFCYQKVKCKIPVVKFCFVSCDFCFCIFVVFFFCFHSNRCSCGWVGLHHPCKGWPSTA